VSICRDTEIQNKARERIRWRVGVKWEDFAVETEFLVYIRKLMFHLEIYSEVNQQVQKENKHTLALINSIASSMIPFKRIYSSVSSAISLDSCAVL
jgi:hypothetical protein